MITSAMYLPSLIEAAVGAMESTTEGAQSTFHMTFGELAVSLTALISAVFSGALVYVSVKLVKVTTLAANAEMAKVSTNANDDMADVATAALHHHAKES